MKTVWEGRGGHVFYSQSEGGLHFYWELGDGCICIRFQSEEKWQAFCDEQSADWARGNRKLIMRQVAEGVKKCMKLKGDIDFDDGWIYIWRRRSCVS